MKGLIVSSLSLLLLAAAAPATRADDTAYNPATSGKAPSYLNAATTPFDLVNLAYQGYFEKEGIPSYNDLIVGYRSKQVSAEDIIKGAVKAKRLPSQVLSDRGYINAVRTQLDAFRFNDVAE
ncbi:MULTISPECIES: hypothetical protein [Nostocales]|uniref:Uncharacterized protein n=3 Tax=Nostocales TaxID=1161 RepID=A0A8S9SYJ7_9CYAN|nr:hypothetical protein [Tolypothrix bouteillei]KAF3885185.1 hypothetical protein DA73_0400006710 [Tolypothrix bouteillei VB521301]